MVKYISFGDCTKKLIYIFLSTMFLLLNRFFIGFSFDEEIKYKIQILDNDNFSNHYLIQEIFEYLFCIIVALILILKEKIGQKKILMNKKEEDNNEILSRRSYTLISNFSIIYRETYEKDESNYSKLSIFSIFFLYISLEQIKIIFKKFFAHMDIWMIELYIVAILNKKIFKIEIYKHQKLAFLINSASLLLNFATIILTLIEGDEKKALYVKYTGLIPIAIIIYGLYAFYLSYSFISIKRLMDLKFISFNKILLIYGTFGCIFCIIFCTVSTFSNMQSGDYIANYLFKVKGDNNQTYIDNFIIYFQSFSNKDINSDFKRNEIIKIFLSSLSFAIYKLYTFKVIEDLTILHKIFSYPLYYFGQKFVFLCVKAYKISDEDKYLKGKLITDTLSDFFSIIGYLIYIEIVQINIFNLNYNLRKNIMARSKMEAHFLENNLGEIQEEDIYSESSKDNNTSSENLDVYE